MVVRSRVQTRYAHRPMPDELDNSDQPPAASSGLPAVPPAAREAAGRLLAAGLGRSGFCDARPRLGVILGTGLGGLIERLEGERILPAADLGWLPRATALGHAGCVAWGRADGRCVLMLQGRVHRYEGQPKEALARGVNLLAAAGVDRLLLTNAAGGVATGLDVGELVLAEDHLDLARAGCSAGLAPGRQSGVVYDQQLTAAAARAAGRAGSRCRLGVYAYVVGPCYETRAEYRMLRRFGADVVGMSTVPEAVAARDFGMRVVAASVVTNLARPDRPVDGAATAGEEVCRAAATAADGIWAIVRELLR